MVALTISLRNLARLSAVLGWLTLGVSQLAQAEQPIAPELRGLSDLRVQVSTKVHKAQLFFDQGVKLLYAFNHQEALRAFREAARLDPALAMAYWGQAMTLAPNLNAPLTPENARLAHRAVAKARRLAAGADARERALIDALSKRFAADAAPPRAALDRAYADAMAGVADRYPGDPDVQTFYADAVMNTMPWDYWQRDGAPKPATARIAAALERVIQAHPNHPGALHYYIHLMEASETPERAEAAADRLGSLMPAAGHIVHMPAHIYIRVGRYADAAEANVRAIAADEDYLAQCQAQGLYPVSYYPHNLHFLWAAATLEGRSAAAIDAARQLAAKVPHHHAGALAWTADFPVTPWLAYARFGRWREMLTEPKPPANQPYAIGIWHYARGLAFVARGDSVRAEAEVTALEQIKAHTAFKTTLKDSPLPTNLEIASLVVGAEVAAQAGRADDAIGLAEQAVATEDRLPYSEPSIWHQPPRQVLGALLLQADRASDAEAVYRADLKRFRENGWSLYGLWRSLERQGRAAEARDVRARFEKAWGRADIQLSASRILSTDDRGIVTRSVSLESGITLPYAEHGDPGGLPVVFLHGVTDSWRSFESVLPFLPQSIRALAITQRGHGDASRPRDGYRYIDFSEDLRGFLDALRIRKAVVVGHSMGSMVAQRFAIDHPDRVLKLVLMGSFKTIRGNAMVEALWNERLSTLTDPVDPDFARAFQQSTLARDVSQDFLEMVVRETLKVPAAVWRATFTEFRAVDFSSRLRDIQSPTLIVWGDRDEVSSRAEQDALQASIPTAELFVYQGAGHGFHWEDPARFARDLVSFVR